MFPEEEVPTRYISSIYLEIGIDNTGKTLGIPYGEFETVYTGRSFYSTSKKAKFEVNCETNSSLDYFGDCSYYQFTPLYNGSYVLETTGTTDTYIYLYDSNMNIINYNDDGGESYNGRIIRTLNAGQTYFIKVQGWNNSRVGDFKFSIMYDIYSALTITENTTITVTINSNEVKLIEFSPTVSGNYSFNTSNNTGDPFLYLYDSNFYELDNDDDSLGNRNSTVTNYLTAGKTYYVLAKCYSNTTGSYSINVIKN